MQQLARDISETDFFGSLSVRLQFPCSRDGLSSAKQSGQHYTKTLVRAISMANLESKGYQGSDRCMFSMVGVRILYDG